MDVFLYDSITALPRDEGNHILVFAGHGSLLKDDMQDIVTEVLCRYRVGNTDIEFARNGDSENVRFEQAFSWAVKYAAAQGIEKVYGVYELDRPLDKSHLRRIFASGVIDKRTRSLFGEEGEDSATLLCPNCSSVLSTAPVPLEATLSAV